MTLTANPGGTRLSGSVDAYAVDGIATFPDLTVRRTGTGYRLRASSNGLVPDTSASFDISHGALAGLIFSSQPTTTPAGTAINPAVSVTLVDAEGNVATTDASPVTLALDENPSSPTLAGNLMRPPLNGVATFGDLSITAASSGYVLSATSGTIETSSTPFEIVGGPGNTVVVSSAPEQLEVSEPHSLLLQLKDRYGNIASTDARSVTLSIGTNPGGAILGGTTTANFVNGVLVPTVSVDRPGNGYTLVITASGLDPVATGPFDVHLRFALISAGGNHTCGITRYGAILCWGANDSGQLGDGTTTDRSLPVPVAMIPGIVFDDVSAGGRHTCAHVRWSVYCWGANSSGQLGDGTTTQRYLPTLVPGSLEFIAVSAGDATTCGTVRFPSTAFCWGDNSTGQIGDGTTQNTTTPTRVNSNGLSFTFGIGAGDSHTCALSDVYEGFCWGDNSRGQHGDGSNTSSFAPSQFPSIQPWTTVSAGGHHTCATKLRSTAYCFGANDSGQLGDGTTTDRNTPTPVTGPVYRTVSAGTDHTCAMAGFDLLCWGSNADGQLGDNTTTQHSTPAIVTPPADVIFSLVSAGGGHTCVLTTAGVAYCWGRNDRGQLGDGTTTQHLTPTKVYP